jgi:glycerol-3-phosphate dehydrogenase
VTSADVIIVGCGVQGATMALCAAQRGLKPLILERARPAAGATGNSMRIVHGGLRYLQSLDIARWRRSWRQQEWLLQNFPDLIRPLRCVMPLYRGRVRSPSLFQAAFAADRTLSKLAGRSSVLPSNRVIRGGAFAGCEIVPADDLVGAAIWYDATFDDAPALVRAILERAGGEADMVRSGVEVRHAIIEGSRLRGVRATDQGTDREVVFNAPAVVLCCGASNHALAARMGRVEPRLSCATLGFNLMFDINVEFSGAIAVSPDPGRGRSYFLRGVKGGLLAGTCYVPLSHRSAACPTPAEVTEFVRILARCAPGLGIDRANVSAVSAGLLPDRDGTGRRLASRRRFLDFGQSGGPNGLYALLGTKLTTAQALSEYAASRIWPGTSPRADDLRAPSRTAHGEPLEGGAHGR